MLVVAMLLCPSTSWTTLVSTPFSSSRVAYPCRRLWGVAEPIPAAWAAAAKVRLSVPRPTGLVAARVGNSQRGLLWVAQKHRFRQRNEPLFVTLTDDAKQSVVAVDGTDLKGRRLADPQTAGVHDGKAGSVDRVRYAAKQPADLGVGKRAGQPLLSRQTDLFFANSAQSRLTVYRYRYWMP